MGTTLFRPAVAWTAVLLCCASHAAAAERPVQVVDALANALPDAEVTVTYRPAAGEPAATQPAVLKLRTNEGGVVNLPGGDSLRGTVRVSHPDYGIASVGLEDPNVASRLVLPLVKRDSAAYTRALRGRVVGPDRKAVADASVRCGHVRTPGEGLISSGTPAVALTGEDGRFCLYLPDAQLIMRRGDFGGNLPDRTREHGELIPENAIYHLTVDGPPGSDLFPLVGEYRNTDQPVIRLTRPAKSRTLRYDNPAGGLLAGDALRGLRVWYYARPDAHDQRLELPQRYFSGGKLAVGVYHAELDRLVFVPLEVKEDSADELTFRLPPPVTFAGRVVDGVTGAPATGAFVIGMTGTGMQSIAAFDAEAWRRLHALGPSPKADDPALEALKQAWSFDVITRTDEQGRYEVTQTPRTSEFYGLIAFDQDRLPILHRLYQTKPNERHRAEVRDIPLFPGAKVLVRPVFKPEGPASEPAVSPKWVTSPRGQPDWYDRFRGAADGGERQFQYDGWLKLNQQQPVFVPAGLSLRVQFDTPYHDEWSAADLSPVLKLDAGQTKDLGDLAFERSLLVTLKVLNARGAPVEGAPVRRLDDRVNVWSVVRNTDAKGLVQFHVRPRSTGQFGIIDLRGLGQPNLPANLVLRYQVGEKLEGDARFEIRMTPEQVELLKGPKPGAV